MVVEDLEHLYSKVDRAAILRAVEAEDREGSTPSLDNISYDDRQGYRGSGTFEGPDTPPPIPTRTIHEEDGDEEQGPMNDPRYATIGSTMSNNHDEGYSTVDETLQRGIKVSGLNSKNTGAIIPAVFLKPDSGSRSQ
jgi:hypothetical protein